MASRTSTVTVADQTFTVTQAGKDCSYNLGTSGASLAWTGGDTSLTITAGAGCGWTVANVPSWITVTSGASGSGTGSGQTIQLTVAANSSTQGRLTTIQVGGQNFDVAQTGVPCSFSLSSSNSILAAAGGSGSVTITAAGSDCEWVASSNAGWITITSASSGNGSATVTYTASANTDAASRSGTLTIAGQNLTITQAGIVCSYALRSPNAVVDSAGGTNSVGVMAAAGCLWTAASQASWITITSGATGSGTANVTFKVDANTGSTARSAVLRIAGQDFGVTQNGVVCVYTLVTSSAGFGELGGTGTFSYSSSGAGCAPVVQSYANWITITSSTFGNGLGTVSYSVPQNITGNARTGTIMVGDVAYTVTQDPSSCSYTLAAPTSWKFDRFGGAGEVDFTSKSASGVSCVPIITRSPEIWLDTLISLPGGFSQPYSVPIYQTFIRWVRTLQIVVNGSVYTVKQTSY